MYNNPIGFFDSGVGGLSVYSRFRNLLPQENTIYFGDLKNLPYGDKSQEELIGYARNILLFFKKQNVKAVVIACNTSSALAYNAIKEEFDFEIYPIIQSCAKAIAEKYRINRLGVFATIGTVNSAAYTREIQRYNPQITVKEVACPNWVSIVENLENKNDFAVKDVKKHLDEMLTFSPEKIILGCTHYPYLINILSEFAPADLFIDPAEIFVDYLKNNIRINDSKNIGSEQFYVSAMPKKFIENAKLFYNVQSLPQVVN